MKLSKITYKKKTYYIDYRLQQFRSIPKNNGIIVFISFSDILGDNILVYGIKHNLINIDLIKI